MDKLADVIQMGKEFLELLRSQHQYYLELEKLAEQRRALVDAQQTEELLKVLARQQKIVDAIGKIHTQTMWYRENWDGFKDKLPVQLKTSIQILLSKLGQILQSILEQDKEDAQKLSGAKNHIQEELKKTTQARKLVGAYAQSRSANGSGKVGGNIQITG